MAFFQDEKALLFQINERFKIKTGLCLESFHIRRNYVKMITLFSYFWNTAFSINLTDSLCLLDVVVQRNKFEKKLYPKISKSIQKFYDRNSEDAVTFKSPIFFVICFTNSRQWTSQIKKKTISFLYFLEFCCLLFSIALY